jgi:hypothetical protein
VRTLLGGLLILMVAAAAFAQSTPGLLRGAAKAALVVKVSAPTKIEASQTTCRISKDAVERQARGGLDNSPVSLTDARPDITLIVEVELYRVDLDDSVNMCIARVSLSAGVKTEVLLPYRDAASEKWAERWVDLFRSERKVARPMNGFDIEVLEAVDSMVKEFVGAWTRDQQM